MKLVLCMVLSIILSARGCFRRRSSPSPPSTKAPPPLGGRSCSVVSRAEWGARRPKSVSYIQLPVSMVFIHHTEGTACYTSTKCNAVIKGIQNYHMNNKGWNDIGYSFLVGEDGNVYEGRGWNKEGAHTKGYNSRSIAISVMGSFTSRLPNNQALQAVKDLIACGVRGGKIRSTYKLYGHRDVAQTSCPGNAFYNHIKTWPHY